MKRLNDILIIMVTILTTIDIVSSYIVLSIYPDRFVEVGPLGLNIFSVSLNYVLVSLLFIINYYIKRNDYLSNLSVFMTFATVIIIVTRIHVLISNFVQLL